jgi:hypothetical protein
MGPMGPNRFGDPWFPSHLGHRKLPTTAVRPTLKWEFGEFTIQSIQKTGDNWRWDDGSPKTTDDGLSKIIPKLENHDKFLGVVWNIMEFWWLPAPRIYGGHYNLHNKLFEAWHLYSNLHNLHNNLPGFCAQPEVNWSCKSARCLPLDAAGSLKKLLINM